MSKKNSKTNIIKTLTGKAFETFEDYTFCSITGPYDLLEELEAGDGNEDEYKLYFYDSFCNRSILEYKEIIGACDRIFSDRAEKLLDKITGKYLILTDVVDGERYINIMHINKVVPREGYPIYNSKLYGTYICINTCKSHKEIDVNIASNHGIHSWITIKQILTEYKGMTKLSIGNFNKLIRILIDTKNINNTEKYEDNMEKIMYLCGIQKEIGNPESV